MRSLSRAITQTYFNSIKVQLEHISSQRGFGLITFQFHKGTIRTTDVQRQIEQTNLFQFHKGTIRTICLNDYYKLNRNFNSIKVQLELLLTAAKFDFS